MGTVRKLSDNRDLHGANEQRQHWSLSQVLLQDHDPFLQFVSFAIESNFSNAIS